MSWDIQTIPHEKQAYNTCGNYWEDANGNFCFRISDMQNPLYEFLVLFHEIIEYTLIKQKGIAIKDIDEFDIQFEHERKLGLHSKIEEPGNDPNAPYYDQHQIATAFERLMAATLGVDWQEYEKTVDSL